MESGDDITPPVAQGNANNGVYNTGVEDIRSPPSRDCRKCQTYLSKFSLEFDTLYFVGRVYCIYIYISNNISL